MKPKCNWKDCTADAVCAVAINVPATGCPVAEHDPIRVVLGYTLCGEHADKMDAKEYLRPPSDLLRLVEMQARGKAAPDYARAFITRVSFDSVEWGILSKRRK